MLFIFHTALFFLPAIRVITNNVEFNTKEEMQSNRIQKVATQKLSHGFPQMPYLGSSYRINTISNIQVPRQHIKCIIPMTFSQKLYQPQAFSLKTQEIADQYYEQALTEANYLEKVDDLLSEIAALAD